MVASQELSLRRGCTRCGLRSGRLRHVGDVHGAVGLCHAKATSEVLRRRRRRGWNQWCSRHVGSVGGAVGSSWAAASGQRVHGVPGAYSVIGVGGAVPVSSVQRVCGDRASEAPRESVGRQRRPRLGRCVGGDWASASR
ncbi:uncharacterized protein LOC128928758 [Callithrix jacchus]